MFGLGSWPDREDFRRVRRHPPRSRWPSACQLRAAAGDLLRPGRALRPPPLLGIGMMLLAASPGGTSANLYSHLFHGDVALNITLTGDQLGARRVDPAARSPAWRSPTTTAARTSRCRSARSLKVFAIVLVPVAIGMLVRSREPAFAARMDRPVRTASAVILAVLVLGHPHRPARERRRATSPTSASSPRCSARSAWSSGYDVPRAVGVVDDQAIASSMEIGVHNATLAIFVAVEVLEDVRSRSRPRSTRC